MINTISDIQTEVLVRLNAATTTTHITDQILNDWTRIAHDFAVGYKKWQFTEGKAVTTYATTNTNENGDVVFPYPEGWKPDSIRLMQVGGKRMEKVTFEDFQIFREEQSSATDRTYTDFSLEYYINPNADVSGSLIVWGQYTPVIDPTDKTVTTVFSQAGNEGNDAIVNEMISYAKTKESNPNEATYYHQKALEVLEGIWKRSQDEQYGYHTKDRGMWKRIDVMDGRPYSDIIKRDQFN